MRAFLLVPALLAACSKEAPTAPDAASTKYQILEILKSWHAAGDRGDVATMKTMLHPEIMMYKGGEEFVRGMDAVEPELEKRAELIKAQGRKTFPVDEKIELIGGEIALVTYVASLSNQRGAVSLLCRKTQGKWLIAHIHDSWPAAVAGTPPK